ncbi:MAG: rhodanese-like domain-containing protein [Oscillospiraceae bacterium]|jgi:phage shock protein E
MSLLKSRKTGIDTLAVEAQNNPQILLLDVRTKPEYREGHIPGSVHLELAEAETIGDIAPDLNQTLYVYCHSGMRSSQACAIYRSMGYTNVTNIGGIASWHGPVEKGDAK